MMAQKLKFDNNAAVLVDDKGEPVGNKNIWTSYKRIEKQRSNEDNFTSSRGNLMIKKGFKVKVLSGRDKNKEGEVIEIDRSKNRAKVKDINMVKKHVKTTKEKKVEFFLKRVLSIFQT